MACFFGHKWDGCKCSKCGKTRDEQHDWDGCKCKRCGKTRDEQHDWDLCKSKCKRCGEMQEGQHDWNGCACKRCGKTRDEQHDWDGCECKRCGKTQHDWDGYKCKCKGCNKILITPEEAVNRLLTIFPRHPLDREGHKDFNKKHEDEVRAIGRALDELGGMSSMRQVGISFAEKLPMHARKLETMWDGIGYWLG